MNESDRKDNDQKLFGNENAKIVLIRMIKVLTDLVLVDTQTMEAVV